MYDPKAAQTTLTVKAAANAPTVAPNAKLKVIGHPTSPSVAPADRSVQIPLDVKLSDYDLTVNGIEVNQGIQTQFDSYYTASGSMSEIRCRLLPSLPVRDWGDLSKPVPYEGVELVSGRKTVVRVFATLSSPFGASVANVPALLYGVGPYGKPLPGSPLSPDDGARTLAYSELPYTTCKQRANPKGAYTFTLPESWTHGKVRLVAKLIPQQTLFGPGAECGSTTCAANDSLTLSEVTFTPLSYVTVTPVRLTFYVEDKQVNPPDPKTVFDLARYLTPGTIYFADGSSDSSYAGVIDISDEVFDSDLSKNTKDANSAQCSEILDELEDWADDNPHGDQTAGVFVSDASVCPGVTDGGSNLLGDHESFSVVAANRPLTSVAHELFHGMGRVHADTACGGNSNGQVGESWPPDQRGQIHGIGLDTHAGSACAAGPTVSCCPHRSSTRTPTANRPNGSTSCRIAGTRIPATSGSPTEAGTRPSTGSDLPKGRREAPRGVAPTGCRNGPAGDRAGLGGRPPDPARRAGDGQETPARPLPYRLVVRDGAGQVVSDTTMVAAPIHAHEGAPAALLKAEAPAAGAASVEIVSAGTVVARLRRSSSAPKVELTAPRAGARVGKGKLVTVAWHAADADNNRLHVELDYSVDGGSRFREIFAGPNRGKITLPSSLFAGTRRALFRLRVSDGFNKSGGFGRRSSPRSAGRPRS